MQKEKPPLGVTNEHMNHDYSSVDQSKFCSLKKVNMGNFKSELLWTPNLGKAGLFVHKATEKRVFTPLYLCSSSFFFFLSSQVLSFYFLSPVTGDYEVNWDFSVEKVFFSVFFC